MSEQFLDNILEHKKSLNKSKQYFFTSLKEKIDKTDFSRYGIFKKQIGQPDQINLIAEIKKASPSKGLIRVEFDLMDIAKTYVANNAAAISVLTEEKYFLGKPEYIKKVTDEFNVPVLTKDFILEEGQIYEAFYNGASAVLLIVAILSDADLKLLMAAAHALDMDCLVEVHDEEELDRALNVGAEIIGINHRNLRTFEVDMTTSEQLIPKIPKDKVIVAESGIKTHADIEKFKGLGVNAVLIGETFMREDDIAAKVQEVMEGK